MGLLRQRLTGVGVGGTEVGESGSARTGVVSDIEVGGTDKTKVQSG